MERFHTHGHAWTDRSPAYHTFGHSASRNSLYLIPDQRWKRGVPSIASCHWSHRSPNFWTRRSCFLSSNRFFQCEHPFIDKSMVITVTWLKQLKLHDDPPFSPPPLHTLRRRLPIPRYMYLSVTLEGKLTRIDQAKLERVRQNRDGTAQFRRPGFTIFLPVWSLDLQSWGVDSSLWYLD